MLQSVWQELIMCCCKQIKMNRKSIHTCIHPYSPTYPWLGYRGSSSSRDTQTSPSPQAVGNWSLGPLPMTATPITQPTPFWTLPRVVSLQEGGPMSFLQAAPSWVLWAWTWPPGACLWAPTPGLAQGWGPSDTSPYDVNCLAVFFFIWAFRTALSLTSQRRPACLGRLYQGH